MASSISQALARDIESAGAEVRRVEAAGKAEVEQLRLGLGELRAYYEEEVDRLNSQVARLRSDADARVVVLAAENDALRQVIATKMQHEERQIIEDEMRDGRSACAAELEETRDAVERHRQRWERDVTKVHEEMRLTRDECKDRIEAGADESCSPRHLPHFQPLCIDLIHNLPKKYGHLTNT